jgi:hypothetical protein
MSKERGFLLSTQETEYSVSYVEKISPLFIPNLFQRYPIYLTLHKILDGTVFIILAFFLFVNFSVFILIIQW